MREHARSVSETIYDRRMKLSQHEPQSFFELIVDNHVLIDAEQSVGEVFERLDGEIDRVLPIIAVKVELSTG